MLKQRLITAIILIPVFIALLFTLSAQAFLILTGVIVIWCAWEWASSLMGVHSYPACLIYPLLMILFLFLAIKLSVTSVLYLALAWWLWATIILILYAYGNTPWLKGTLIRAVMGWFVLVPCWLALNYLFIEDGPYPVLFLFVLVWGADIGAYFAGKQWGKHKLAPTISPGKSWEGLLGALMATVIIVLIALSITQTHLRYWPVAFLLSFITVLFSVIGDLFESMLKRVEGIKDSGHLLPGHGGVLDRLDSLTAAAPIYVLGTYLIGKFYH